MMKFFRKLRGLTHPVFPRSLGENIRGWVQAKTFEMRIAQQNFEINSERERRHLLSRAKHQDKRDLIRFGYSVFSQYDEDGIISAICSRLPNVPRKFVEIGTGGAEGIENNTMFLLLKGWSGVWIEGDKSDFKSLEKAKRENKYEFKNIELINEYVSSKNINTILEESNFSLSSEIGVLSLDIDSIDLDIIEALNPLNCAVIVIEYNAIYPPDIEFRVTQHDPRIDGKTSYFGASLAAFREVLRGRGYELVGCGLTGANAYFVRSDLATKDRFIVQESTESYYEPPRYYLAWGKRNGMVRKMALGSVREERQ